MDSITQWAEDKAYDPRDNDDDGDILEDKKHSHSSKIQEIDISDFKNMLKHYFHYLYIHHSLNYLQNCKVYRHHYFLLLQSPLVYEELFNPGRTVVPYREPSDQSKL